MKCPSEMLQNLPYFIYMKNKICSFHFSFRAALFFPLMNALVYVDCVDIDQHKPLITEESLLLPNSHLHTV